MLRLLVFTGLLWSAAAPSAFAEEVRYFGVWSYIQNSVGDEISAEDRSGRRLGYWALAFDSDGQVLGGTYHGSDGTPWVSVKYVQVEDRVYADLFSPDGVNQGRKSTRLSDRRPRSLSE